MCHTPRVSTLTWLLPTPCTKRWDELGGAGDRRSCETCGQAVVDLTERDAAEAARLLSGGEAPCARVCKPLALINISLL